MSALPTTDLDKIAVIFLLLKEILLPTIITVLLLLVFIVFLIWVYTRIWGK